MRGLSFVKQHSRGNKIKRTPLTYLNQSNKQAIETGIEIFIDRDTFKKVKDNKTVRMEPQISYLVHLAHLVHLVHQVHQVLLDLLGHLVILDRWDFQVQLIMKTLFH